MQKKEKGSVPNSTSALLNAFKSGVFSVSSKNEKKNQMIYFNAVFMKNNQHQNLRLKLYQKTENQEVQIKENKLKYYPKTIASETTYCTCISTSP